MPGHESVTPREEAGSFAKVDPTESANAEKSMENSDGSVAGGDGNGMTGFEASVAELLDGENIYPLVSGVLAVKVVSGEIRAEIDPDMMVIVRLRVRNITRYTGKGKKWGDRLAWGTMTYFPTRVIRNPRHPFNLFQIDVLAIPSYVSIPIALQRDDFVFGSVPFHMHDLVKGSPSAGSFTILKNHRPVGQISLEIYFTYGAYGFGYSPQFTVNDDPEALIKFAMLPRSIPDAKEAWSQTLIAPVGKQHTRLLNDEAHAKEFPLVHSRMKRFKVLRQQLNSIDTRDRLSKIAFLYRQVNSSSEHVNIASTTSITREEAAPHRDPNYFQRFMKRAIASKAFAKTGSISREKPLV